MSDLIGMTFRSLLHYFGFSTRPATASRRRTISASRASGAVISACSSAPRQLQPAAAASSQGSVFGKESAPPSEPAASGSGSNS